MSMPCGLVHASGTAGLRRHRFVRYLEGTFLILLTTSPFFSEHLYRELVG